MEDLHRRQKAEAYLAMTDRQLARELLSRDLLFHKIPEDQVDSYVTCALEIGEEAARPYIGRDMKELCAQRGIRIFYSEGDGRYFKTEIRTEITIGEGKNAITIYKGSVEDLYQNISTFICQEQLISREQALQMLLAHEFFHFLEEESGRRTNEMLPKVVCWRLPGVWQKTATILTLSEVGAHRFCQTVLKLGHFPYLYDKLYALNLT